MTKHNLAIFLGDVQDYLAVVAKNYDRSAWLLDRSNYSTVETELEHRNVTVYTSLGDLPKDLALVSDILAKADIIFYRPPEQWSDGKILDITDPGNSMQGLTEILLLLLPRTVRIDGFHPFSPLDRDPIALVDQRKTNQPQLWIAGCSVSHGVGIESNERYGHLLAKDLNMDCSFLTRLGSAIDWAADQILRSDIRKNDLVIWGITAWNRLTYVHNNTLLQGINLSVYDSYPEYHKIVDITNLFSSQTFYNHFYSIQQVINYCEKIGAKLLLVGLLQGNYSLLGFLKSLPNYVHIPYKLSYQDSMLLQEFEDLGTDRLHPGPKQHQLYKQIISDFIKAN